MHGLENAWVKDVVGPETVDNGGLIVE